MRSCLQDLVDDLYSRLSVHHLRSLNAHLLESEEALDWYHEHKKQHPRQCRCSQEPH